MRRLRTWLRRHRASVGGYFWIPCPSCGEMFGGHEWRDIDGHRSTIPDGNEWTRGKGICPSCTRAGVGDAAYARIGITFDP